MPKIAYASYPSWRYNTKKVYLLMSSSFNIILLVICGVVAFILIKRMRSGGKKIAHLSPADQQAQEVYNQNRHKEDEDKSLTLQEKIELSWAFLTNITEQVMNRFSNQDQQKVENAGQALSKNGAKYQHNVNREANIVQAVIKTRVKDQNKGQSVSR
jgi:hypothetical protein